MKRVIALGEAIAANGAVTGVEMSVTPMLEGRDVTAQFCPDAAFDGTVDIQGSDDDASYSNIITGLTGTGNLIKGLELPRYTRINVTGRSAGNVSVYLTADD